MRCQYCEMAANKPIVSRLVGTNIREMRIMHDYLRIERTDNSYEKVGIYYCPICGRELT